MKSLQKVYNARRIVQGRKAQGKKGLKSLIFREGLQKVYRTGASVKAVWFAGICIAILTYDQSPEY